MDKYIYNEKNGLWYELHGDYYLPCLKLPKEESRHIGIWGQRHLRYLKQHRKVLYSELLISGKLNSYIADINEHAEEMSQFNAEKYQMPVAFSLSSNIISIYTNNI